MKNMNNNPNFTITAESATRALITINKPNNGVEMELENRYKKRKFSEIMLIDEIWTDMTNPFSKFSTKIKQISKNKESEENK